MMQTLNKPALALLVLVLVTAAFACASQAEMKQLLPKDNALPGWTGIAETYIYAPNAAKLVDLYDGDDARYRNHGVVEAATKTYKSGDRIMQVFVHRTTGWQKAKSLFVHFKQRVPSESQHGRVVIKNDGYMYSVAGLTQGYGWRGKYFFSVKTYSNTAQDRAAAKAFLRKIAASADKLVKASK